MFKNLKPQEKFCSFFDFNGQKISYAIENIGFNEDFEADAFLVYCNNKALIIPYLLEDLEAVIDNLPIIYEEQQKSEERKILSLRMPVAVIEDLKKIAKSQGLPYQTLMNQILFLYTQNNKN